MVSLLGVGVAAAAWPGDRSQIAYPAPPVDKPAALPSDAASAQEPVLRPTGSPRPTTGPALTRAKAVAKPKTTSVPAGKPVPTPPLKVVGSRYATATLNVRTTPDRDSHVVAVAKTGSKLSVTASVQDGFRFISYKGHGRWVSDKYLSGKKPKASATSGRSSSGGGISAAPCRSGSAVERGLTRDAIRVHRALCARYPQISAFGGLRPGDSGFHGSGRALDSMISNSTIGWNIARWVRANASKLGASEVIYYQKIWTVQRSSEGWRPMADRGSRTANHYDHVHVSVYGNRGTT
jgi:hypothetical protein